MVADTPNLSIPNSVLFKKWLSKDQPFSGLDLCMFTLWSIPFLYSAGEHKDDVSSLLFDLTSLVLHEY